MAVIEQGIGVDADTAAVLVVGKQALKYTKYYRLSHLKVMVGVSSSFLLTTVI